MATNPSSEIDNIPVSCHGDKNLENFPREGVSNVGECDWCVICGQISRKKGRERLVTPTRHTHHYLPH